jgi:hypothetical protein
MIMIMHDHDDDHHHHHHHNYNYVAMVVTVARMLKLATNHVRRQTAAYPTAKSTS